MDFGGIGRRRCVVHCRERLPLDQNLLGSVLGVGAARCHHDGHGLANVPDHVTREHVLEERRHVTMAWYAARDRRQVRWQIGRGHDSGDTVGLRRLDRVDRHDSGVRMGAPQHKSFKRERHLQIGNVASFAAKESLVLDPREARTEHRKSGQISVEDMTILDDRNPIQLEARAAQRDIDV